MSKEASFLDDSYTAPTAQGGYMKFEQGENKFRILSRPILGWLDWKDKKPLRFRMDAKPNAPIDPAKKIKHFWAVAVWNYSKEEVQVLEITQSGLQNSITALSRDEDWGSPLGYDLKVTRTGSGMETEYVINPLPHKPTSKDILEAYANKPINLEALYDGGDPFAKK